MKRNILLSVLLLLSIAASAQLRVGSDGHVGINGWSSSNSYLTVGSYNLGNASVGITSSPEVLNMDNIGVEGAVSANSNNTNDTNYGVLGIITLMNILTAETMVLVACLDSAIVRLLMAQEFMVLIL